MCGRAYSPRFLFTWPNARISRDGRRAGRERARDRAPRQYRGRGQDLDGGGGGGLQGADPRRSYEAEGNPYYATARLWDDGIILPSETRRVLGLAFSACLNAPVEETRFGVFRM